VKVKLTTPKSIRGEQTPKDTVVDVSDGVAQWLIDRKEAVKVSKGKKG
jgi:hypothetical protein